jgi:hypothetical protein
MIRLRFCSVDVTIQFRGYIVDEVRKMRSFTFNVERKLRFCTVNAVKMHISYKFDEICFFLSFV